MGTGFSRRIFLIKAMSVMFQITVKNIDKLQLLMVFAKNKLSIRLYVEVVNGSSITKRLWKNELIFDSIKLYSKI